MSRFVTITFIVVAFATPAVAAPAGQQIAPRASAFKRGVDRVKRVARKAGLFVAPVRVGKTNGGSLKLVRWGVSKEGSPVRKEELVQFPNGSQRWVKLSYELKDGERKLQRETTRTARSGRNETDTAVTTTTSTEGGSREARSATKLKPLTPARAYGKAFMASPVVHFAMTTGFFYLFWEVAPQAVGIHLGSTKAMMAALATKCLTLPLVTAHTLKELRLGSKRPDGVSKAAWKLMQRENKANERQANAECRVGELGAVATLTPRQEKALGKARDTVAAQSRIAADARTALASLGDTL